MTSKEKEDHILAGEGTPKGPATTVAAGLNLWFRIRNLEEWIGGNHTSVADHVKNLQLYKQYWDNSPAEITVAVRLLED